MTIRRHISLIILALCALAAPAHAQLIFTPDSWDFGTISETDGRVSHTFTGENRSDKPVVILDVVTTCGCTVPDFSKKPILPGEKTQITVTYDPANRPGSFTKELWVYSSEKRKIATLTVQGSVIPRQKTVEELYPVDAGGGLRLASTLNAFSYIYPGRQVQAAIGYAKFSGIPYGVGLIKNRYIARTFIQPGQDKRERSVRLKLNALRTAIEGKRVIMVDDSIVRGTPCGRLVKLLRDAGAAEVHMRISAPPFRHPCFFGTDIPDQKLLVATGRTVDQINEIIGADTLGYLSTEHVVQLTQNANCGFCTACFTGKYAVKPEEVLSTDIHERHLNDRPKDEKKLGE